MRPAKPKNARGNCQRKESRPSEAPRGTGAGARKTLGWIQAAERPPVQQKQDKGDGYQHRLGHQAQSERKKDRHISRQGGTPRISKVSKEYQHEKEPAQDVLSLRNPGDRLHM